MTLADDVTVDYPYKGMPLKSGIFAVLAGDMFSGQLMKRADIINGVAEHHFGNGGLPGTQALIPIAKKALTAMSRAGLVERIDGAYGMWRFSAAEDGQSEDHFEGEDSDADDDDVNEEQLLQSAPHCIYVYDYPAYAELAALQGSDRWPHKIGFTRLTAEARVADQIGTALPENPRIVMSHHSPNAPLLERALHATMELRGQKITDVPGTEWFNTNPNEIQALIDFIVGPHVGD